MSYLIVSLTVRQIARIFAKIQRDPVTSCWNWTGTISDGYGNVRYDGHVERSHRVVYAWAVGPIPRQPQRTGPRWTIPQLDHVVCRNRRCCNPVHLELVTQKVNILRGRGACAQNARKITCSAGLHSLPLEPNEKVGRGRMGRRCTECAKTRHRNAYLNRKAKFSG